MKAVVKGTKVTLKLNKCDAVMVWEVAEGKTAADAPVTAGADGVIVKPALVPTVRLMVPVTGPLL